MESSCADHGSPYLVRGKYFWACMLLLPRAIDFLLGTKRGGTAMVTFFNKAPRREWLIVGLFCLGVFTPELATCEFNHLVIWYSTAPDQQTRELAAERYQIGVTGLINGDDRQAIRELNPSFKWFVYNSLTDNYVPPHAGLTTEHDSLVSMATARGWDPEEAYIHYYDDTTIVMRGDTILIPGWGGGSATSAAEARVPVYLTELTRRATNFSTTRARQLYKELNIMMLLDQPFPDSSPPFYADGIYFDNSSGRLFNRGSVLSGGRVLEAPGMANVGSNEFRDWYFDTVTTFLASLKDTLETSASWSKDGKRKELMINIVDVWEDTYVTKDVADYLYLEFLYNPVRNWGIDAITEAYRRDSLAASAGIRLAYSSTMTRSVSGLEGEYSLADIMLGNFAWYLLSRTPSTLFYQQGTNSPATAGWDTLTWRGVMDEAALRLGDPLGPPYTLQSGTDPLGNPFAIKARDYSGGLVVLRNRGNWSEGIQMETAVDVPLPQSLLPLSTSGALLPSTNQLSLRNGEGAILVYAGTAVTLQSFTATPEAQGVTIQWTVSTESPDHLGFHVFREDEDGTRRQLTSSLLSNETTYTYVDTEPLSGPTSYYLAEWSRDSKVIWYGPVTVEQIPFGGGISSLDQNSPNPFSKQTTIRFNVATPGHHQIRIFDVRGRAVASLLDGVPTLGLHEVRWDGRNSEGLLMPPGTYFYRLETPARVHTHKMLLLRP